MNKSIEIVNLKNKNITFISQSLVQQISCFVKYLYLDCNSIRILPDELFTCCPNLLWLDLRCNRVRRLPDGIRDHQNLQVLLLGKNDMKRLPLTLGSLPKLRELQIAGNPLDYPSRNIIKKGSKYLIKFLQDEWNSNQSKNEISDFNNEVSQIKKADCKTIQRNNINDKNHTNTSKMRLMERYSWPMIFLTNWSSDRLVTDRDIRIKELERLYLEKQKVVLEKQEHILQSYKNKETLKIWRDKAKQLQFLGNSQKLNNYQGLDIPFGVDKEFSKMISRQMYRKVLRDRHVLTDLYSKECITNITYKNIAKRTKVKPYDFDLEMSDIYKMLMRVTSSDTKNVKNGKNNVLIPSTSNIDWEMQKLHEIQKKIAQLKIHMIS